MKKEIKYELVLCPICKGETFTKIQSCSCTSCETINTCKHCNSKGKIKVVRSTSKNNQ